MNVLQMMEALNEVEKEKLEEREDGEASTSAEKDEDREGEGESPAKRARKEQEDLKVREMFRLLSFAFVSIFCSRRTQSAHSSPSTRCATFRWRSIFRREPSSRYGI